MTLRRAGISASDQSGLRLSSTNVQARYCCARDGYLCRSLFNWRLLSVVRAAAGTIAIFGGVYGTIKTDDQLGEFRYFSDNEYRQCLSSWPYTRCGSAAT